MGAAFADIFGDPVTVSPGGGGAVEVKAMIRNEEVELDLGEGEPVVGTFTVLKLPASAASGLIRGDQVVGGGVTYEIRHALPRRNPASDAMRAFVLEKIA